MCPSIVAAATIVLAILTTGIADPTSAVHAFVGTPSPIHQFKHHNTHQQLFQEPSRLYYPSIFHRKLLRPEPIWRVSGGRVGAFQMTATASDEDLEKEISSMRVAQIRQELESYGISTKSFFEKSELIEALVAARKEGKVPIAGGGGDAKSATSSGSTSSSSTASGSGTSNRQERIQQEIEKCNKLKIGELKKELESHGVSTKSYFEKSEFVRAVAEARVDGPPKKKETSASTSASASSSSGRVRDEPRDPSYRDVIVTKFPGNKSLLEGKIIEVRSR